MDNITTLLLAHLRESPTNPRTTFDEAKLAELAESIKTQGVMQPIVVRTAPDRPGDQRNLLVTHEIVFGHRRYRAALLAGLESVPCIVRELDAEQAAIAQLHENLHREDVSPIEEADGYARLMHDHKVRVEDLMARTNKSRSYVYGRVRLASAAPEVRSAVINEGLGSEIAQRVARQPSHNLQRKALKAIRAPEYMGGTWLSDRASKDALKRLTIPLLESPFSLTDAKLVPSAGACTPCPQRAGNDPDLASELDTDTCLDSECHARKCAAYQAKRLSAARKAGQPVIEGEEAARLIRAAWQANPDGYTRLDSDLFSECDPEDADREVDVTLRQALERLGSDAPKVTLIVHPHRDGELIEALTDDQAEAIVSRLAPKTDDALLTPSSAARAHDEGGFSLRSRDEPEEEHTLEQRALTWPLWAQVQKAVMVAVCARPERTADELLLVARALLSDFDDVPDAVIDCMGWRADYEASDSNAWDSEAEWCLDRLSRSNEHELARFAVLMAVANMPISHRGLGMDEKRQLLAGYGVDPLAAAGLKEQTDDAGADGGEPDRDPNTSDMFEAAQS